MTTRISPAMLEELSRLVAHHMGLHFPKNRWRELMRGISSAAPEFGLTDAESCIELLLSGQLEKKQIEILAPHLTVGETYFFREQKTLDILKDHILPKLIQTRRNTEPRLQIWSAACSTGEEPYSLAIILNQLISDTKNWQINIIATDINPQALKKAREGIYGEWSFRGTPQWIKEKYFERTNKNQYKIIPEIKKIVTFSNLNLAGDMSPFLLNSNNAMDIIFCRNVLMYFTPEWISKIVKKFNQYLTEGGWLVTSPVDAPHFHITNFTPVNFHGVTVYQKSENPTRGVENVVIPTAVSPENTNFLKNQVTRNSSPVELATELNNTLLLKNSEQQTPPEKTLSLSEQNHHREMADKDLKHISFDLKKAQDLALLAQDCADQGKLDEALGWAKKAVDSDKSRADFHFLMSSILQEQGQVEDAIISLKRTLYLAPEFIPAYFAMGNLTRQQGRSKESEKYFQNALALLSNYEQDQILPESGGINAGRLMEIIKLTLNSEISR